MHLKNAAPTLCVQVRGNTSQARSCFELAPLGSLLRRIECYELVYAEGIGKDLGLEF